MRPIIGLLITAFCFSPASQAREVSFSWDPIPEALGYEIQVAEKSTFDVLVQKKLTKKSAVDFDLPLGRYFYRVRAIDQEKKFGLWAEPMDLVVTPYPPELVLPRSEASFNYFEIFPTVRFEWKTVSGADEYQIFVYKTTGKKALEERVKGDTFSTDKLEEGEYMWKVKTITGIFEGHYGEPRRFIVEKKSFSPPKLISPIQGAQVPAYRPFVLKWEKDPITKYSDVTVNVPPDTRGAGFVRTNLEADETWVESLEPGIYRWSVKSQEGPHTPGQSSEVESFEVRGDLLSSGNTKIELGFAGLREDSTSGSFANSRSTLLPFWNAKYYLSESFGLEFSLLSLSMARAPWAYGAVRAQAAMALRMGAEGFQQDILLGYRSSDETVAPLASQANVLTLLGPMAGVDMRGPLGRNWRLLVRFVYFKPLENSQNLGTSVQVDSYDGAVGLGYHLTDQLWLNYRYLHERTVGRIPTSNATIEWETTRSSPFSLGLSWEF